MALAQGINLERPVLARVVKSFLVGYPSFTGSLPHLVKLGLYVGVTE